MDFVVEKLDRSLVVVVAAGGRRRRNDIEQGDRRLLLGFLRFDAVSQVRDCLFPGHVQGEQGREGVENGGDYVCFFESDGVLVWESLLGWGLCTVV